MIPDHDARLLPPEPRDAPCRNCSHAGEDHEEDGRCLNDVRVQRWTRDGDPRPYWITVPCDCEGYEPRTADDDAADEADRYYDDYRSGGF